MKKLALFLAICFTIFAQKSPLTPETLWKFERVSSLHFNKTRNIAAFVVQKWNVENNSSTTDIYGIDLTNNNVFPIVNSNEIEHSPIFSNDGNYLYFIKNNQIHLKDLNNNREEQISNIPTGVNGIIISPDNKYILFTSYIYPMKTAEETAKIDEEKSKNKVKAKIFDKLLYRHWDSWRDEKRSHLFLFNLKTFEYKDITSILPNDVPPLALGSNSDYCFAPDSKEIAFCYNPDEFLAKSTNNEIFVLNVDDIKAGQMITYTKISRSRGVDCMPKYSPDGQFLAFLSMKRAGYEADKKDIIIYNRTTKKYDNLTEQFNLSVESFEFLDNNTIYFTAYNEVNQSIFKIDINTKKISNIRNENYNYNLIVTNNSLLYLKQKTTLPTEVFKCDLDGKNETQLTYINKSILENIEFGETSTFWYKGANNDNVQAQLVLPPFFDKNKKYPMILLIHGGPQGAWSDNFHYRWNVQMFAAFGYVVVAPNIRGSVGYGQTFTDGVNKDWGGKPFVDAMKCVDFVLSNFSFVDKNNLFAAGASYGGYMMNWIATQTDRFNAIVSHAGVFNLESMYGTTEELWFPEWEYGGTPYENRTIYDKFSPHKYVKNIKTPMLVVHGAYDFRVPESQAFELFTYLQRLGIKSKFLYFPDETHFVAKPQNSLLWWKTVMEWYNENKK